jgi:predicted amidohydrolase YtcJ
VLAAQAAARQPEPDMILWNGKVVTVDSAFSLAQAVAIRDGRFVAVGTNDAVRKLAGPSTRLLNLGGHTVIPGLADGHLHSAGGGPGVDLSRTRSMEQVLQAIAARAKVTKRGEVVVTNADWHEAQLREQRLPLRHDLDRAAPNTPVVVVRGGHEMILNSAALAKWKITPSTPVPAGGQITRGDGGELTGELIDAAMSLVQLPPTPPLTIESLAAEHRRLNAAGLTSIRYPGASVEQYRLLGEMRRRGLLTMRVNFLFRLDGATSADSVRVQVGSWSVAPDEGDEWLRVGGVKLIVDGGFEGGWMFDPYAEPYGKNGSYRGLQVVPGDQFAVTVKTLGSLGWRVATHAVGDAAIDRVLTAYEAADAERSIAGRRWAIEHAFIARDEQIARMKRLGLVVSAQDHLYLAGPRLVKYWGAERAARTTPMRAFIDAGLVTAGGTDSPVIPYPPLWVIYHFVTRNTISGGVLGADQRITRQEALRTETINNAYLTFEEKSKGSIEPGKLADLVVLSDDILTVSDRALESLQVTMTIVGGKIVYRKVR